ncbi:hypothetical protein BDV95DRAFT_609109 [Massariosphaeria phaeospora]|uniref:Uncharacterized protein n=1 Tax=Massariosphaeria phaeospora TaxID=100035 RepID=A0A7C8I6R4_9PLEO|nr:hypothetical protein BDV95DRAFT_609109 [Massariosphaeria phaeospora]
MSPNTSHRYDEVSIDDGELGSCRRFLEDGQVDKIDPELEKLRAHSGPPVTEDHKSIHEKNASSPQLTPVDSSEDAPLHSNKMYWLSPAVMIGTLLLRCALAAGHHTYYKTLDKEDVGSIDAQQWALRIGNFLAIGASFCLKGAVGTAYVQIMWRRLSSGYMTLKGIDHAFDASYSFFSIFNRELVYTLHTGMLVAIVLW